MPRTLTFAVFRAGTHTDSAGNEREWTTDDLDRIASRYSEQSAHEAPIVIGHPKDNAPAYGWIKRLYRMGEELFAEATSVADEFVDWIQRGLYRKRSIALYPDMLLRHVGFLGAVPPAVKGLPDVAFAQSDAALVTFEFSDRTEFAQSWVWENIRRLFQGVREYLIEIKGVEVADRHLPSWTIENLVPPEPATADYADPLPPKQEPRMPDPNTPAPSPDDAAALRARLAEVEAENAALHAAQRASEFSAFLDTPEIKAKVTPAMRPRLIALFTAAPDAVEIEFSEGDGDAKKTVKESREDLIKNFLRSIPDQVAFGDVATSQKVAPAADTDADVAFGKAIAGSLPARS